jgi:hypothetical protein
MTGFYRRWVFANGWSEGVGLGTTFVAGTLLVPSLSRVEGPLGVIMSMLGAIAMGIALEGILVGIAQERVLRERFAALPRRAWTTATAIGAGLAWTLGMVPSTLLSLSEAGASGEIAEPPAMLKYALAMLLGAVAGPVLGFSQWAVLRHHARHAKRWLWANALAWSAGMPLIFAGMEIVPWNGPIHMTWAAIFLVCSAAGLVVGAMHGLVLDRLIETRRFDVPSRHASAA